MINLNAMYHHDINQVSKSYSPKETNLINYIKLTTKDKVLFDKVTFKCDKLNKSLTYHHIHRTAQIAQLKIITI